MLTIDKLVAIFKKIKSGQIKAHKAGRNYLIARGEIETILGDNLSDHKKDEIDIAVTRVLKEYGQTIKLLGKE